MVSLREISEHLFADKVDLVRNEVETLDNTLLKKYFFSRIAYLEGNFDLQYQMCQEILVDENLDPLTKVLTLDSMSWYYIRKGEYDFAYDFGLLIFEIMRENKDEIIEQFPDLEGKVYNTLGSIAVETGKLDEAINQFTHSLEIETKICNKVGIAVTQNNLAHAMQKQGKLREALNLLEKSSKAYHDMKAFGMYCFVKSNIAEIYRFLTNFRKALQYHQEVLEYRTQTDNLYNQGSSYYFVGLTYFDMGNIKLAKQSLEIAAKFWREIGNTQWLSASLFVLGKIGLELGEDITSILEELKESNDAEFNNLIHQRYILLLSIYYLSERRMHTVALAQTNLTKLLDMEVRDFEIAYETSMVYTQLLFIELRMHDDIAIYDKIKDQINFMENLAKDNLAYGRIIDILFLRAKLSIADSNYLTTEKYLYQAQITAEECDLQSYLKTIELVQNEVRADILKFQTIIDKNKKLFDRLELLQVSDYLTMVHRVKEELDQ